MDHRWRGEELGTFDPDQDDVFAFISRIRQLSAMRGNQLVTSNIYVQLRGKAISCRSLTLDLS